MYNLNIALYRVSQVDQFIISCIKRHSIQDVSLTGHSSITRRQWQIQKKFRTNCSILIYNIKLSALVQSIW